MASFMQNWWDKHDMDRDGKGCFFIALGLAGMLILFGMCLGILCILAICKLT